MKFDLSQPLLNYNGQPFTKSLPDGAGGLRNEPTVLKEVLESACVNADPQQYNDATKKLLIFRLLMKIHQANPVVDFTAEDLTTLKELTGKQLTIAAVGAVYEALENPLTDRVPR